MKEQKRRLFLLFCCSTRFKCSCASVIVLCSVFYLAIAYWSEFIYNSVTFKNNNNMHKIGDRQYIRKLHVDRIEQPLDTTNTSAPYESATRNRKNRSTQLLSGRELLRPPYWCDRCNKHSFRFIHNNPDICKRKDNNTTIELIILIASTYKQSERRNALRKTWLSYARNNLQDSNLRYIFMLGLQSAEDEQLRYESNIFKDIIQGDFKDSYRNLTYKTIMGFKWVTTNCKDARFVMKTDDDVYINIPNLLNVMKNYTKTLNTAIAGRCLNSTRPIRAPKSKVFVPKTLFPYRIYPPYCTGMGYITSMKVISKVAEISENIPYFPLEDVFTGICIKKLGLSTLTLPGFHSRFRVKANPCIYNGNTMITSHGVTPDLMKKMWNSTCD